MTLNERVTTQLGGKIAPALRVVAKCGPLGVAHRLFGMTKPYSARLDWSVFRHNADNQIGVHRP